MATLRLSSPWPIAADQKFAELGADLDDLGMKTLDYRRLDFESSNPANYQNSPSALFLSQQIESKDGKDVERAYSLGARIQACLFMTQTQMFSIDDKGYNARIELDAIDHEAEHFGVTPVSLDKADYEDRETVNLGMRVKLDTLDGELRNKL